MSRRTVNGFYVVYFVSPSSQNQSQGFRFCTLVYSMQACVVRTLFCFPSYAGETPLIRLVDPFEARLEQLRRAILEVYCFYV